MSEYDNTESLPRRLVERIEAGMGCGSYVLNGWRSIVLKLDEDLAQIDPHYKVDQIKEKFGGLRYYVTLSDDVTEEQRNQIYDLIDKAEARSVETCDVCGNPGEHGTTSRGWIVTRCNEHKNQ